MTFIRSVEKVLPHKVLNEEQLNKALQNLRTHKAIIYSKALGHFKNKNLYYPGH